MNVAITGASGHIGNCLVRKLLEQNIAVKVLVHNYKQSLKDLDVEIVKGDLLQKSSLEALCRNVDVVFHLAAKICIDGKNKDSVYTINVEGTQNLIDVCIKNKVKRFIHFSSIHTYDPYPLDKTLDESRAYIGNTKLVYEQ